MDLVIKDYIGASKISERMNRNDGRMSCLHGALSLSCKQEGSRACIEYLYILVVAQLWLASFSSKPTGSMTQSVHNESALKSLELLVLSRTASTTIDYNYIWKLLELLGANFSIARMKLDLQIASR